MVASVGKDVESLRFRLLGTLQVSRGGDLLKLPSSRKVRALLGYLVLASRPVARSQVCELWRVAPLQHHGPEAAAIFASRRGPAEQRQPRASNREM